MNLRKEYEKKLKRAEFQVIGRCSCGRDAKIMFHNKKYCFKCWTKLRPYQPMRGEVVKSSPAPSSLKFWFEVFIGKRSLTEEVLIRMRR